MYLRVQESTIQLECLPWAKVPAWGVRMPEVAHQRHGSVAYEVDLKEKQRNPVFSEYYTVSLAVLLNQV